MNRRPNRTPVGAIVGRALLPATLLLAACSSGSDAPPGTTTADEDRQLNEAAAMLDSNSIDLDAVSNADDPANADPVTAAPVTAAPVTANESPAP
ncbi:MAG: hypothetical protein M3R64_03245 [Pseudomonadota bacterium]|nr:hypothetical protein [Pseudomonadota bacterium]